MVNKYKLPVTQRAFKELDDDDFLAFQMEARNAAASIANRFNSHSPEFQVQLAKELNKLAKQKYESISKQTRELEQPRDDEGRFQAADTNRGEVSGAGARSIADAISKPAGRSLYEPTESFADFPIVSGGMRKVDWNAD